MSLIKYKYLLNSILLLCITVICAAYFIQYVLGYQPCNLCIIERIPYIASIILILFVLIVKKYEKNAAIIMLLLFVFGALISSYHVGIEQGFFSESFVCNLKKVDNSISANDLLKELEKNTISCKIVDFELFGLSLATLNTILSLVLSVIMFKAIKNYE